jgi:hypothetical protein
LNSLEASAKTSSKAEQVRASPSAPVSKSPERQLAKSSQRFNKETLTVKVTNPKQIQKINALASIYLTPTVVVDNKNRKPIAHKDGWESQLKDFLI